MLRIQQAIGEAFGEDAIESPATIARELAHEGGELRHPEIIECDARWREAQIESEARKLDGLQAFFEVEPLSLKKAEALIKKLEKLRKQSERTGDRTSLLGLRDLAVKARLAAHSLAQNRALDQIGRAEQSEIAEWLAVWIQTPKLFGEWLELRRRAPEFRNKFATEKDR
ncbi:MAG: hypothetical protein DMF73_11915 [Acidobacteria bacterium]|nr:MAG: hypothetical protein DMF73_11915 [Acidobacteriota bacterium]